MSIRIMTQAWNTKLASTQKLVLLALADNANDQGYCWPSQETIRKKCGIDRRTTQRITKALAQLGHLTKLEQKHRQSITYIIHPIEVVETRAAPDRPKGGTDDKTRAAPRRLNHQEIRQRTSQSNAAPQQSAIPGAEQYRRDLEDYAISRRLQIGQKPEEIAHALGVTLERIARAAKNRK